MPSNPLRILLVSAFLAHWVVGAAVAQFELPPSFSFGSDPYSQDAEGDPVEISAYFTPSSSNQPAALVVVAKIAPGYHIYALTQPPGGPGATLIEVAPSTDYLLKSAFIPSQAPEVHIDTEIWEGLRIEEHTGEVAWIAPIELAEGVDLSSLIIPIRIDLQACQATTCQPILLDIQAKLGNLDTRLAQFLPVNGVAEVPVKQSESPTKETPVQEESTAVSQQEIAEETPLLIILGFALLGGLILNLMPCVLPVIGLKVLSFAEQGGQSRGKVLALNIAYSTGLIGVFLLLALLASLTQLGLSSESFGWGELYTINEFKIGMIVLVFAMGLSFLGVWEIPIPGFAGAGKANELQSDEGISGAFFKGVFTTVLATPCSGPFLGPVFGYTLAQPPETTFLIFLFVGLGMASPYLLIGVFPNLVRWLPKPGAWMETFKQLMGFVLMGTVVYLLSTVSRELYLPMLTTLVAVGLACWWIGRTPMTASASQRSTAWLGGTAISVATGLIAFSMIAPSDKELPWKEYNKAALAQAQASGKTVLVDFSADWCLTCKLNLKRAINTTRVKEVVEENGIEALLADWTDRNDEIKEALAELGSRSIPLLAIYPADRPNSPILLRDVISEQQLLDALRQAGAVRGNESALVDMPEFEFGDAMSDVSKLR